MSVYRDRAGVTCATCAKPLRNGIGYGWHHYADGYRVDFADVQWGRIAARGVPNEPCCSDACEVAWWAEYERAHGIKGWHPRTLWRRAEEVAPPERTATANEVPRPWWSRLMWSALAAIATRPGATPPP